MKLIYLNNNLIGVILFDDQTIFIKNNYINYFNLIKKINNNEFDYVFLNNNIYSFKEIEEKNNKNYNFYFDEQKNSFTYNNKIYKIEKYNKNKFFFFKKEGINVLIKVIEILNESFSCPQCNLKIIF